MFWKSPPWESVTYWALDLETGGLRADRDPIIAVGMVPIREGAVRLGEAWRTLVRPDAPISPESMRAHQLVPSELREAPPVAEVLAGVAERLRGHALLVHYAAVDVAFLRCGFKACGLRWPRPPVVDTVELLTRVADARRFLDPEGTSARVPLNLTAARAAFDLPAYGAHDALLDAIAAAELFLVLRSRLGARTLRQIVL